jgi:hypothetical protein
MLIWTLRGPVGLKLLIAFHLIILASGLGLYLSGNPILDMTVLSITLVMFSQTILYMIDQKDQITFSTKEALNRAFPIKKSALKRGDFWLLVACVIIFIISIGFLFSKASFDLITGATIAVSYYIGSLGWIHAINNQYQRANPTI